MRADLSAPSLAEMVGKTSNPGLASRGRFSSTATGDVAASHSAQGQLSSPRPYAPFLSLPSQSLKPATTPFSSQRPPQQNPLPQRPPSYMSLLNDAVPQRLEQRLELIPEPAKLHSLIPTPQQNPLPQRPPQQQTPFPYSPLPQSPYTPFSSSPLLPRPPSPGLQQGPNFTQTHTTTLPTQPNSHTSAFSASHTQTTQLQQEINKIKQAQIEEERRKAEAERRKAEEEKRKAEEEEEEKRKAEEQRKKEEAELQRKAEEEERRREEERLRKEEAEAGQEPRIPVVPAVASVV